MFDFYCIKNDEMYLIPLAYNTFIFVFKNSTKMPQYERDIALSDQFINELKIYIETLYSKNKTSKIILDFKNIVFCNRAFENYNNSKFIDNLFFVNVGNDLLIGERIIESINGLQKENDVYGKNINDLKIVEKLDYRKIYSMHIMEILQLNNVIETGGIKFLDSSGIYSSTYTHINRIFYCFNSYMFIIYELAKHIYDFGIDKIDALISTSKTGGIIATLVGKLLNKKVVHCLGLGPKNTSISNIFNKIRRDKSYYVVSDFVCLGTEIKTLNTIITLAGANLIGGISVASYINTTSDKYAESILNKIISLVNTKEQNIDYIISGFSDDLGGAND